MDVEEYGDLMESVSIEALNKIHVLNIGMPGSIPLETRPIDERLANAYASPSQSSCHRISFNWLFCATVRDVGNFTLTSTIMLPRSVGFLLEGIP